MTKKDILYFGTCVVGLGINSICAACCCKPKLDDGKQNLDNGKTKPEDGKDFIVKALGVQEKNIKYIEKMHKNCSPIKYLKITKRLSDEYLKDFVVVYLSIGFVEYHGSTDQYGIQDDGFVGFIALIDRKASLNISDDYLERCNNPYYFLSCMVRKKVGLVDIFFEADINADVDKELNYVCKYLE